MYTVCDMSKRTGGASRTKAEAMDREMLLLKKLNRGESTGEKIADALTSFFGTIGFLLFNVALFAVWLLINLGYIEGFIPFDPFPFELLTMVVSLEAICLAVIVLISQNRASKVGDLREQLDVEIDMQTFKNMEQVTKTLSSIEQRLIQLEKQSERPRYPRGSRAF